MASRSSMLPDMMVRSRSPARRRDDGAPSDDRAVADADSGHDHGAVAEPDIVADHGVPAPGQAGDEVKVPGPGTTHHGEGER